MTLSTTRSATSCEPRQATPRNPDASTDGAAAAVVARLLGRTMPPWARAAVDVIGERDAVGHYAYPLVVILVPRQSAKTTTVLDVAQGRGMVDPDYRAAYAAQTGHVTTERFSDRFTDLEGSPFSSRLRLRRSQGTERITDTRTRSYVKAYPPKAGALRSNALDLVIVDEAQEHDDLLGVALDRTIFPTFTTRPRRQFVILGTAPDVAGTYLERYADLARAGTPGVALVDYGATPDDDLEDPATWWRRHPGLAAGLTDEAFLAEQLRLDPAGFAREHLNVWPTGPVRAPAKLPPDRWAAAFDASSAPGDPVTFGLAVAVDGAAAAIAAAGRYVDEDGLERIAVEVVEAGAGTAWVPGAWRAIRNRTRGRLLVDALSPAAPVIDALAAARLPVEPVTTTAYVTACAAFLDDVTTGRLAHRGQPALDDAAAAATSRNVGDRWVWDRRAVDGTELVEACTLAAAGARRPASRPTVVAGGSN